MYVSNSLKQKRWQAGLTHFKFIGEANGKLEKSDSKRISVLKCVQSLLPMVTFFFFCFCFL